MLLHPVFGSRSMILVLVSGLGMGISAADHPRPPLSSPPRSSAVSQSAPPRPDHVVVIFEENHSYSEIIGSSSAPYINSLAGQGVLFTNYFAQYHPSEQNYLEIFSGSDQGIGSSDPNPAPGSPFSTANWGGDLIAAGFGSGAALFVKPMAYVIRVEDYRAAFLYTGIAIGLVILGGILWMRGLRQEAKPAVASAAH